MKTKRVAYRDLFNPDEVIEASNRLWSPGQIVWDVKARSRFEMFRGNREDFLRQRAEATKCRCRHPMIMDGRCYYRTCRHTVETHA